MTKGKRIKAAKEKVGRTKTYELLDAVKLLKENSKVNFDFINLIASRWEIKLDEQ